ncbi:hypothetical protein KXX17_001823, partial [Aspergillus fumigatus]
KAKPDNDIIGIGAKRVPRADVRQRQVEKEAIQIGIIKRVAALDQRHMRIEALGLAALAGLRQLLGQRYGQPDYCLPWASIADLTAMLRAAQTVQIRLRARPSHSRRGSLKSG